MFTDIIKQFDHIIEAVKQTDVKQKPFKHLYVTEVLGVHEYRTITEFDTHDDLTCTDEYGRKEYDLDITDWNLWEEKSHQLFEEICKKLKLGRPHADGRGVETKVPATIKFWSDSSQFKITDIHTDAFYDTDLTISCQIYLPKDDSQYKLGTRLYRYIGDDIQQDANQDEGTKYPHQAKHDKLDKWEHRLTVPYRPNCMLVTVSTPDSWHQAPVIENNTRNSLMLRFKV